MFVHLLLSIQHSLSLSLSLLISLSLSISLSISLSHSFSLFLSHSFPLSLFLSLTHVGVHAPFPNGYYPCRALIIFTNLTWPKRRIKDFIIPLNMRNKVIRINNFKSYDIWMLFRIPIALFRGLNILFNVKYSVVKKNDDHL